MSSTKPTTTRKRNIKLASIAGVGAAALLAIGLAVPSGATFTDSKPAHIAIDAATLTVAVSDTDQRSGIDVTFNNLKPGEVQHQDFTVKNTGSIAGVVTVGSNFTEGTPAANVDYNQLSVGISGASSLIPVTQLSQSPTQWNLGTLNAGESKTYTFDVSLDQAAGNEWQGQTFGGNVPVTLTQQ